MTLKRRSLMGPRLAKMKGLSPEEKDILVRIGDLVDATINNRAPTNPFEPHSPERRDPRLPSVGSMESEEGVRSTVLTWDPVDASILAYYKLEITNLSTGVTKVFVSYTNRFVYKDSSGEYMVRLFTIGKNQTASPPIKFIFTLAGSVMFLNGTCNGIGTIGQTSVCTDIFVPKGYFVHVWVSFNYNGLADPQDNLSPIINLKSTSDPDNIDLAHMPIQQSIQVFPESISLTNIDDSSTQAEITRPTTIAVRDADGHYDTSMAIMFSAFQVQDADAGQVNRICAEITRRTADIDNLCIAAWVASAGISDFISDSVAFPDCREPDHTVAAQEFDSASVPFSNSENDAEVYSTMSGMISGSEGDRNYPDYQYLTFFTVMSTVSGADIGGAGVSHRPGWRRDPNLIETGNNSAVRNTINARDSVSASGVFLSGFAKRTADTSLNGPLRGYVLTMRQQGITDVSDTKQHSTGIAWTTEAFGVEGRDWHLVGLGSFAIGANDVDASTSGTLTIEEGREGNYLFFAHSAFDTGAAQVGWPLTWRHNWEIDGVDIMGVRSDTQGPTRTGRGFSAHHVRVATLQDPFVENCWLEMGVVNLEEGDHTVTCKGSLYENVSVASGSIVANSRMFLARTDLMNFLGYHTFTGELRMNGNVFNEDTWYSIEDVLAGGPGQATEDLSITIESDVNCVVFFHTSVACIPGVTPHFQLYQNGTALYGPNGTWHNTWQNTGYSPTNNQLDPDGDLHPITLVRLINNPGFSNFTVKMSKNGTGNDVLCNVADDGSETYKGFFGVLELNFCL